MRQDVYTEMARVEESHWWFRARRRIIRHVLNKAELPQNIAILDAGSGTGGNLSMLSSYGTLYAMEMDDGARALANAKGLVNVESGMLPANLPFAQQQFDLAVMFDVLEHVEQDFDALVALHHRLQPGGRLLLTVPAFELLWSAHDEMHHHKRRYSLAPLILLVERAGYKVTFASYINFWLFPLIALLRLLGRLSPGTREKQENAELKIPPAALNGLLERVFASEARLTDRFRLPFGVSIILLSQKL